MKPTEAVPHPDDWVTSTVGRSIEFRRGVSWSKEQESSESRDGRIPVIRVGNVQKALNLTDLLWLSDLSDDVVRAKTVTAGWTLMVSSNGNRRRVGNAVLIREDLECIFASFLLGARPIARSDLSSEYFFRWLTTTEVQAYLAATAEGTTGLNNLSHSFLRSMVIPIPPPHEQAAICRVLRAVDAAVQSAIQLVETARAVERAHVERAFAELRATPGRLKDFVADIRYGTSTASNDRGWGYPALRIPNVISDRLKLDEITNVDLPPEEAGRLKLADGDLLMVRTNGNPTYVGRSAVFSAPDDRAWIYASYLIRVRLRPGLAPDFVHLFLGTQKGRAEVLRRVTTSAGNNNINANSIKLLTVPVPDDDEQGAVIDLARRCRDVVDAAVRRWQALEVLRAALSHDLVLGRVRMPSLVRALVS